MKWKRTRIDDHDANSMDRGQAGPATEMQGSSMDRISRVSNSGRLEILDLISGRPEISTSLNEN